MQGGADKVGVPVKERCVESPTEQAPASGSWCKSVKGHPVSKECTVPSECPESVRRTDSTDNSECVSRHLVSRLHLL